MYEHTGLLGFAAVLLGEYFAAFWRIMVPSS